MELNVKVKIVRIVKRNQIRAKKKVMEITASTRAARFKAA